MRAATARGMLSGRPSGEADKGLEISKDRIAATVSTALAIAAVDAPASLIAAPTARAASAASPSAS